MPVISLFLWYEIKTAKREAVDLNLTRFPQYLRYLSLVIFSKINSYKKHHFGSAISLNSRN